VTKHGLGYESVERSPCLAAFTLCFFALSSVFSRRSLTVRPWPICAMEGRLWSSVYEHHKITYISVTKPDHSPRTLSQGNSPDASIRRQRHGALNSTSRRIPVLRRRVQLRHAVSGWRRGSDRVEVVNLQVIVVHVCTRKER
jgi:hypothetical protein